MSKKIKLLQDGRDKTLPKVAKIETQLAEGENCYWIPEDDVPLGVLQVSTDGVYNAASDPNGPFYGYSEVRVSGVGTREMGQLAEITITKNGSYAANVDQSGPFYGYSKVIVNVPTSGEGGDPTSRPTISGQGDDGNDEVVGTDDDGNLVYEKIPSSIKVITTPDNLEYEDGQSILFDGLYVKAYLKDGTEWGVVPNTDLIKPVTVAESDGESYTQESYSATSDEIQEPVSFQNGFEISGYASIYYTSWSYLFETYCVLLTEGRIMIVSNKYQDIVYKYKSWRADWGEQEPDEWRTSTPNGINSYLYDNKTAYYAVIGTTQPYQFNGLYNYLDYGKAAWAILYGDVVHTPGGSTQTIPLQWKRPGDKKVLETSFTITVSSSGDNNTSGNTTPGGTNIDVPQ